MAMRKKKASKKVKKSRTRQRNFPPLENAASQKQLETLKDAALEFLKVVEKTDVVPIGYMRHVFTELATDFRSNLKARRVIPSYESKSGLNPKLRSFKKN